MASKRTLRKIERRSERTNRTRYGISHDKYHTTIEIFEADYGRGPSVQVRFDVTRNGININNWQDSLRPSIVKYLGIEAEVAALGLSC